MDLMCNVALLIYLNQSLLAFYIYTTVQCVAILFLCFVVANASYLALAPRSSYAATWEGPGQPYLIPCRTTHRRLFPQKHSFSYSYLTVGVPVGYKGSANGMIAISEQPSSPFGGMFPFANLFSQSWYRIQASDHLQRGHDELDLRGKLDSYLRSEVRIQLLAIGSLLMQTRELLRQTSHMPI